MEMTMDVCDGDYLGAYRRFLEHFVANLSQDDQLPVRMACREVRECEVTGEIADITLKHLNQRICPPSLQAYLVKLVRNECNILFQKQPEECGYRAQEKKFSPLKLMQTVTNKVNEICQRYLDNSRLALLPPPPSTPLPLASSYAIKNRRRKMEDRSVILHDLHTMFSIKNDAVVNYYAVFDGHGGQEAATYCAAHLHQYLIESTFYPVDPVVALRDAFYTTDSRFLECDETKNSGATAVCALLYDKTLYIAWAGDSQAALIKNGRGINLTIPHKPESPDEKSRIESLGGEVIFYGSWRVNGVLNVSRSLGDAKYKPFVSGEPEIKKIELDGTEDFLIVACDGFWERATEDIVASLLYEYVSSSDCDYSSASVALVNWAKQNFSEDNISVIVVFLTPPAKIAAKLFFDPRPVPQTNIMEQPGYQEEADLDFSNFSKQPQHELQPNLVDDSLIQHTNGSDHFASSGLETLNGKHRPKPPRYNDDDDDDEDEEEEDDLGPETNVDAVDDAPEEFGKLDQAMGQNYPDDFLQHGKREDDDFPMEMKQRHQNELIAEADNVADSEDSEDEWNYYRPEENKQQQNSNSLGQSQKDPSLVEKPDQCDEEKEPCSPKPCDEDSEDESQIVAELQSSRDNQLEEIGTTDDADAEDVVTAEFDELHEQQIAAKDQQQLKELEIEAESATIPEEDFPYDKEPEPHQFSDQFEQQSNELQFNEQPEQLQFNGEFEQQPKEFEEQFEHHQFNDQVEEQPEELQFNEKPEQQQFDDQFNKQSEQQTFNEQLEQSEFNKQSEQQQFNEQFELQPEQQQFNRQCELQPEELQFNEQSEKQQFNDQFEPRPEELELNKQSEPQQFNEQFEEQNLNGQFEQQSEQQTFNEQFEEQNLNGQFEQQSEQQTFNEQFEEQNLNGQFEQQSEQQTFNEQFEEQNLNGQFEQQSEQQTFNEQLEQQPEKQQLNEESEQQDEELSNKELYQSEEKLEQHLDIAIEREREVETEEDIDMESHLNPDAAEFVPTSTNTSPLVPPIIDQMSSDLLAGSPLKQSQRALKNRKIPTEQEFHEEICCRPSEIDDSTVSDYSNGDAQSPIKDATNRDILAGIVDANNDVLTGFTDTSECTEFNPLTFDDSEISSTRAECGDESGANYSIASELYKTGISTIDCSYTGNERNDFDFSVQDPMATSMTPGDFKTAFEQEPDLNKVHELNDDDLVGDVQNGTIEETAEQIVDDGMDDDLVKEKIELDFENFIPQQEQNAEVFSAVVDQRESADNKDMFMNLRNNEHGYEIEQNNEEHNLIESNEQSALISKENEKDFTENEKISEFALDENPVYASNNPFSSEYVPGTEQANNVEILVDDIKNVTLEESNHQGLEENSVLTPEEPEMQKNVLNEVMLNPLNLNFGGVTAEQKNDEPVLVSPIKEPEIMSSKFEEEDLMSRSMETLQLEQNQKQEQNEFYSQSNHVEDLIPNSVQPEENLAVSPMDDVQQAVTESLDRKSINLSESLQEFTGLEEQLSPKHEVKDNILETPQILKENLVDEQKDIEEVEASALIPEPKLEETPQVSNELPVSNEITENVAPVAAVAAVATAAAVTTAVAAGVAATKSTKPSTAVSKTAKPAVTSKIGSKSTTPTSPTKTGAAAKTGTTTTAKKLASTSTPRAKTTASATAKPAANSLSKTTTSAKSTTAPRTVASTATKTTRTATTTAAAPRAKPLSSVTSKISSTSTEKKPTANGEVKPPPIGRSAPPPKAKTATSTSSTASKTGLVSKTSTTTRMNTNSSTTSAPKTRPASAATTKTTTSRLSSATVTSSTNGISARPKTAPTSTLNAATKSKIAGAKSPMIDKQIKETANKQISSARSTTTAATTKSRLSTVNSSSTAPAKRTTLVQKQSTAGVTASPTKKPPPISKPGSKTGTATSKVNSKVTSTTKTSATTIATTKVVQNGICDAEKTVEISTNNTTTVDTTNIEEDIPKKDISPIEPVTDNQLITAE